MNWNDQPTASPPEDRKVTGARRGLLTAVLAVGLLGVGGVAAVMAASPDPNASTAPSATEQPSDNGGTTAPSTRPGRGAAHDCPDKGRDGNGGSSGSGSDSSGSGSSSSGGSNGVSGSDA